MNEFNIENEIIVEVDLEQEIKQSFLDYSMSVIVSRALPDVRDGLKPVHRRILYSMGENGLTHEKPTRKRATIVGAVLGSYHPHGDQSVYGALVRLAQSFSMRYPLVEGQGNFGSVDGDPPAAYRYTEARMERITAMMLADIDKDTVDFIPNFDDTTTEPTVLPARFPNLLVNGSSGIAVGMAPNVPPPTLGEVVDAVVYLVDNPDCDVLQLMDFVQGPDFPTGGIIMGRSGIRAAYATGRGKLALRGRAEIEEMKNGRFRIVVTEIPYMVNKAELIKSIAELVKDKRVEGISDLRDESDKQGMRIVIELKRDVNAQVVLNQLYRFTQLQDSVGIIMLALDGGVPKVMDLKTMLARFIEFREDVIRRRTEYELKKASERAHILEGLARAVDIVDDIIRTIRATKGGQAEAKLAIMEKFGFDDPQASAIVAFRLGQLAGLEILRIENELAELHAKIADYNDILVNREHLESIIKEELLEIKTKYGDARRTDIAAISGEVDIEDLIPEEECIISRTHFGYVMRQATDVNRTQRRGGRGVSGLSRREDDFVEELFSCSSHDHLLFMTSLGRVYCIKSYEVPEGSRQSRGVNIVNLLPLLPEEKISSVIKVADFDDAKYIVMVTKNGTIKRTHLDQFQNIRKTGIIALSLDEGDELAFTEMTNGSDELLIATKKGMAIHISETDVRPMGRPAMGVRAIKLTADDSVVAMTKVNEDTVVLTVTETGYGRKSSIADYRLQNRGGKGITNYRVEKYGDVAAVLNVTDEDDVIMIASDGVIIRVHASQISTFNRPSKGVRVKKVTGDTIILSAAISEHDDEEEFTVPEAPDADAAEAITEEENEGENETEEKAEE